MKRKHIYLGIAAVLAAGGLWFARSGGDDSEQNLADSPSVADRQTTRGRLIPGQMNVAGPGHSEADQTRRFRDFTPEQRVQQARKGNGPGG